MRASLIWRVAVLLAAVGQLGSVLGDVMFTTSDNYTVVLSSMPADFGVDLPDAGVEGWLRVRVV
jgi:hypothetical protein